MSQAEVIDCLKKHKRKMSRTEIAIATGIGACNVSVLLNKLIKFNEVLFEEIDRIEAEKKFGVKRRMKLFYLEDIL